MISLKLYNVELNAQLDTPMKYLTHFIQQNTANSLEII
jgi:hypothetical protein